jgi:MATE family multidrug resistance protein
MPFTLESKVLIRLALPVFIAQLFITSMSFVDTAMAGHYSRNDLAAIAVGGSFWLPAFLFTQAILFAVTPLVAQAMGRKNPLQASAALRQGLWLGFFVGLGVAVIMLVLLPVIKNIGIDVDVQEITKEYLLWLALGLPLVGVYQAMRSFIEGCGRTAPIMLINGMGFLCHIPINYVLIHGKLGFPEMGGAGCGLSTTIVVLIMIVLLYLYIKFSDFRQIAFLNSENKPQRVYQLNLLRLGLPIGFAMLAEVSIFSIIALLIASLGSDVIAGHQVALNLSAQTFMLPFSLGIALTIRVGFLLGEKNLSAVQHTVKVGLGLALISSSITACFMLFGSGLIASVYTSDVQVQMIAASLLFFAAVYQFPDALQAASIGILRGFKITKLPMLYTFFAYWVVAIPLGYSLGLMNVWGEPMGARGMWLGLVVGLSVAACLLVSTVFYVLKHPEKHLENCEL